MNNFKITVTPISMEAIKRGEKQFVILAEGYCLGAQEDLTNWKPNTLLNEKQRDDNSKTRMHAYLKGYGGIESLLYLIDSLPENELEALAAAVMVKRGAIKMDGYDGNVLNPAAILVLAEKMNQNH